MCLSRYVSFWSSEGLDECNSSEIGERIEELEI